MATASIILQRVLHLVGLIFLEVFKQANYSGKEHAFVCRYLKLKTQEGRVGSIYYGYPVAWQKVPL